MHRLFALLAIAVLLIAPVSMIGGEAAAQAAFVTAPCHQAPESSPRMPTPHQDDRDLPGMSAHCAVSCAMIPPSVPMLAPHLSSVDAPPVERLLVKLSGLPPAHEPPPPR